MEIPSSDLRAFNSISHLLHISKVKYQVEHEKRNSISTSSHVLFCLLILIKDDFFDNFPKITNYMYFPKIFQTCSEGQMNVSKHFLDISKLFPKITTDNQRRSMMLKMFQSFTKCYQNDVLLFSKCDDIIFQR